MKNSTTTNLLYITYINYAQSGWNKVFCNNGQRWPSWSFFLYFMGFFHLGNYTPNEHRQKVRIFVSLINWFIRIWNSRIQGVLLARINMNIVNCDEIIAGIFCDEVVQDYIHMPYLSVLKIFLPWRWMWSGLFTSPTKTC